MAQHLVVSVRLYEDGFGTARFHGMSQGAPEWPPAPARVFQALVAGSACGKTLPGRLVAAIQWLETLQPPIIAAPVRILGQRTSIYVPNNDADSLADPRDVSGIRAAKLIRPSLFPAKAPLLYAWSVNGGPGDVEALIEAAHGIYQLGRGVDMAWAVAQVISDDELCAMLETYVGVVHRPEPGIGGALMLTCPMPGSLASLALRHKAVRLSVDGSGKKARMLFTNPPKARFVSIAYGVARRQAIYELRDRLQSRPWPWALGRAVKLVEKLRDTAAARLRTGLNDEHSQIERALIGRTAEDKRTGPVVPRVRIVPLPSIGSEHADYAIRRVLIEIPSSTPLRAADVEWAFSGLDWVDSETGEVGPMILTRSESQDVLRHYLGPSRRWFSVTAVVLPASVRRRQFDAKGGNRAVIGAQERIDEEAYAAAAVRHALRHAGLIARATSVRVQREPFEAKGLRAESFSGGTRFAANRLWHVEIEFDRVIEGPLVIGDGRFLGLGVMAPVACVAAKSIARNPNRAPVVTTPSRSGLFVLEIPDVEQAIDDDPIVLARALRRAVMARVRDTLGVAHDAGLDRFFCGHGRDGMELKSASRHLAFQWDSARRRLLVIAPHRLERRRPTWMEAHYLQTLDQALDSLVELRAGKAGRFGVRRSEPAGAEPLESSSRTWRTLTPYLVTRHLRRSSAVEAIASDVLAECDRCALPRPKITVSNVRAAPGMGLMGNVELEFTVAVAGPIALGRSSHLGGGLFAAVP